MNIQELLDKIKANPQNLQFSEIILFVDENYVFTPTKFTNGDAVNEAGQNSGSCKVFSFAKMHGLSEAETLACFGDYYRNDVKGKPEGTDHQNIRNFMKFGWERVYFEGEALGI
jgi:hypothetical protein